MTTDLKATLAAVAAALLFAVGIALAGTRFRAGGELSLPVIALGGAAGQEAAAPTLPAAAGPSVSCRPLAEFLSPQSPTPAAPAGAQAQREVSDACP